MSARLEFMPGPDAPPAEAVEVADERRSKHPIDLLSRRMDRACTEAADALEIAAALEAEGYSDRRAREEYGVRDVFELAEELYRRVPHRPRAAARAEGTRRALRDLGRGALFALPALFYPAALQAIGGGAGPALEIALVCSWGWSQGAVRLAHRLLGRGQAGAAARLLRLALAAGVAVVAGLAASFGPGPAALAAGLAAYLLSAAVLLAYEREERLALALAPGALAGVACALPLGLPPTSALVGGALTALLAAWQAMAAAGRPSPGPGPSEGELWEAVPFVAYGALCAAFLGALAGGLAALPGVAGLALAPLALAGGVTERELRRLRAETTDLLAATASPAAFAAGAWRAFLGGLGRYSLVLAVLTLAVGGVAELAGGLPPEGWLLLGAHLLLGPGMYVGLVLSAYSRVKVALACLAVAALAGLAASHLPWAATPEARHATAALVGCACFAFGVLPSARPALGRLSSHRL